MTGGLALVTGASSGIGEATALRLASEGFHVVALARRMDRLRTLADKHENITPFELDVTSDESVAHLQHWLGDRKVRLLVANAGGAFDAETVANADLDSWRRTYDVNVLGAVRVVRAVLPNLITSGDGQIVLTGSTAGHVVYETGGSYTAAKHAEHALAGTLRLELCGQPVRVTEIAPGMVKTEEFAVNRFDGDTEKAAQVYAGVAQPLRAEDVADAIVWAATRPSHVNIDFLVIRPLAQAAQHKVHRVT